MDQLPNKNEYALAPLKHEREDIMKLYEACEEFKDFIMTIPTEDTYTYGEYILEKHICTFWLPNHLGPDDLFNIGILNFSPTRIAQMIKGRHPAAAFAKDSWVLLSATWEFVHLCLGTKAYMNIGKANIIPFVYPYDGEPTDVFSKKNFEKIMRKWMKVIGLAIKLSNKTLLLSKAVAATVQKYLCGGKQGLRKFFKDNQEKLISLSDKELKVGCHPERFLNVTFHGWKIEEQSEDNDRILTIFKREILRDEDAPKCTMASDIINEEKGSPAWFLQQEASRQAFQRLRKKNEEALFVLRGGNKNDIDWTRGHQKLIENWFIPQAASRMVNGELTPDDEEKVKSMADGNRKKYNRIIEQIKVKNDFIFIPQAAARMVNGELTPEDERRVKSMADGDDDEYNIIIDSIKSMKNNQDDFGFMSQAAARMVDGELTPDDEKRVKDMADGDDDEYNAIVSMIKSRKNKQDDFGFMSQAAARMINGMLTDDDEKRIKTMAKDDDEYNTIIGNIRNIKRGQDKIAALCKNLWEKKNARLGIELDKSSTYSIECKCPRKICQHRVTMRLTVTSQVRYADGVPKNNSKNIGFDIYHNKQDAYDYKTRPIASTKTKYGSGSQWKQVRNLLNGLKTGETAFQRQIRNITESKKREGEITVGRSTYYIKFQEVPDRLVVRDNCKACKRNQRSNISVVCIDDNEDRYTVSRDALRKRVEDKEKKKKKEEKKKKKEEEKKKKKDKKEKKKKTARPL